MKILEVKFKNIHSLEGEHCIDFQDKRFTQNHIFAITGATGSGKSTILDAIALALYNQTPRMPKISSNEIQKNGAIITRGKHEAYSQVKYECEKGIFTSQWAIRIKRTGTIDNVQMQLYDQNGTPLFQNKQDIPKANSQNIGLNYEQFVKSILLAQGDFALFLKVSKKERSTLLEQITGTEIYRILGKQAFEKNKEVRQRIKTLEDNKEMIIQKILQEEIRQEYQKQLTENETNIQEIKLKIKQLQAQQNDCKKLNELTEKLADFDQKIAQNTQKQNEFSQNEGKKLILHSKTDAFAEELLLWKTNSDELLSIQKNITKKQTEKEQISAQKDNFLTKVEEFIGKKSSLANFQTDLLDFQKEINELENQKNQKLSDYRECVIQINNHLKNIDYQDVNPEKINLLKENLLQKETQIRLSKNEIETQFPNIQNLDISTEIQSLKDLGKQLQNAERLSVEIQQKQADFEQKQAEKQSAEKLLETLPNQLKINKLETEVCEEKLKNLRLEKEKSELRKSLEAYREKLIDGEPCPLCGAEHHPYSTHYVQVTDDFSQKINHEEKNLRQLQKNLAITENLLQNTTEIHSKSSNYIEELSQWLSSKKMDFQQQFKMFSIKENWIEKLKENEQKIHFLEKYQHEQKVLQNITQLIPLLDVLARILDEGKETKNLLISKLKGKNVTQEVAYFQQNWADLELQFQTITQQIADLEFRLNKIQTELQSIENQVKERILELDFESISHAVSQRLPFEEAQRLIAKKQSLQDENQLLTGQRVIVLDNFEQLKKNIPISVNQEILSEEIDKTNSELTDLENNTINLKLLLQNDQQYRQELAFYEEKIASETQKNTAWRLLDMLIGDATGSKFNQFAQDLTLQQLVGLANRRLLKLSPRYFLSQPTENEDDSLIIIDKDMGGERRSVKTLSGGETFILSLSLALALSDLASNNVKIKSLFIDEGFGTLDTETLDQTLDTLERLQQESDKMIGIISHIETLKEQISTQIQVKQKGSGFSEIEIISK